MAYVAEHPANPEFATFGDSLWWGIVTLTTVGYGDIVPETEKGRLAGVFLMLTGVATLGVISGTLASAFRSSNRAAAAEDAADQADDGAVDERAASDGGRGGDHRRPAGAAGRPAGPPRRARAARRDARRAQQPVAAGLARSSAAVGPSRRTYAGGHDHDQRPPGSRPCPQGGALDGAVEGALRRGHHHRAVHGVRGLRGHLPPRRHRLRARGGQVPALPPRGGARARQLHPRREGLHHLHPRLPPLPGVGAGGRPPPLRPGPRARRDGRHLAAAAADAGGRHRPAAGRAGRRVRLGDADLAARARLHRGRPGQRRGARRRLEGQAGPRPHEGGGAGHRRQPLHVLRQPARAA